MTTDVTPSQELAFSEIRARGMDVIRADAVKPGDMIDLSGDIYADPDREDVAYEFEYGKVDEVFYVRDYEHRVVAIELTFSTGDVISFPPNHALVLGAPDPERAL